MKLSMNLKVMRVWVIHLLKQVQVWKSKKRIIQLIWSKLKLVD